MSKSFKKLIKEKREVDFPKTFEIVHDTFLGLGLDKKTKSISLIMQVKLLKN